MNRWKDAEGNPDWDAYAAEADEAVETEVVGTFITEYLGDGRSISRGYGGCATCDGGGCGDCR